MEEKRQGNAITVNVKHNERELVQVYTKFSEMKKRRE
jgi:hypothetical protein